MTAILGLSAYYHDSAAALLVDGRIVAAAQEERFTRIKHDAAFPRQAVQYCLREAGLRTEDLDHVVFYEKPFLKFERLLETYLGVAPAGLRSFQAAMPGWVREKLRLGSELSRGLEGRYRRRFLYLEHHESHAASAFYPSPFESAAILTLDGVGEWATSTIGYGQDNRIELRQELRFPHSLGLLYSAFTSFCGFKVNSGEYKLMGLAPFGTPRYADLIREKLVDLKEDGSFRLDLSYFDYCAGLAMTSRKFERLFGGPARDPEGPMTQREKDLAASIQQVTEDVMLRMAAHAHRITGSKNLCLAGGVALNCVGNGRLLRESPFDRVWVQPAAGDAGGALGAAWFAWHQLLERPRKARPRDAQHGSFLGPQPEPAETEAVLRNAGAVFHRTQSRIERDSLVVQALAASQVVGWVQGRMEFGPRALGARSILGDPRHPDMQRVMNLKIKFRESFRPFAPVVLQEKATAAFDWPAAADSPYMLMVAPVRPSQQLPAVTHVDRSARLQTVDAERNPDLHGLLSAWDAQTGCPVLINTSFNIRGEPMVCTAADAYRCFMATDIDLLVIGDFVLRKSDQPESSAAGREAYLSQYGKD